MIPGHKVLVNRGVIKQYPLSLAYRTPDDCENSLKLPKYPSASSVSSVPSAILTRTVTITLHTLMEAKKQYGSSLRTNLDEKKS